MHFAIKIQNILIKKQETKPLNRQESSSKADLYFIMLLLN